MKEKKSKFNLFFYTLIDILILFPVRNIFYNMIKNQILYYSFTNLQ